MALLLIDLYIIVGLALTAFMYIGVYKDNISIMLGDGSQDDEDITKRVRERFDNHFTSSALTWTFLWPIKLATPV